MKIKKENANNHPHTYLHVPAPTCTYLWKEFSGPVSGFTGSTQPLKLAFDDAESPSGQRRQCASEMAPARSPYRPSGQVRHALRLLEGLNFPAGQSWQPREDSTEAGEKAEVEEGVEEEGGVEVEVAVAALQKPALKGSSPNRLQRATVLRVSPPVYLR